MRFFDSNVLIAASIAEHVHHQACKRILADLRKKKDGACGAHSLAETYNNLTRSPRGYGLHAADALRIVQEIVPHSTIVTLTAKETVATIAAAANLGIVEAMIYDALLIACARKVQAHLIYTYNVKHFLKIAPDLAARILTP